MHRAPRSPPSGGPCSSTVQVHPPDIQQTSQRRSLISGYLGKLEPPSQLVCATSSQKTSDSERINATWTAHGARSRSRATRTRAARALCRHRAAPRHRAWDSQSLPLPSPHICHHATQAQDIQHLTVPVAGFAQDEADQELHGVVGSRRFALTPRTLALTVPLVVQSPQESQVQPRDACLCCLSTPRSHARH